MYVLNKLNFKRETNSHIKIQIDFFLKFFKFKKKIPLVRFLENGKKICVGKYLTNKNIKYLKYINNISI